MIIKQYVLRFSEQELEELRALAKAHGMNLLQFFTSAIAKFKAKLERDQERPPAHK